MLPEQLRAGQKSRSDATRQCVVDEERTEIACDALPPELAAKSQLKPSVTYFLVPEVRCT